jgi:DNA polymerase-1
VVEQIMSWYLSLPSADAVVPCGNGSHTVRWEAGQLTLPGHPDAEAELVLGALGGGKPACITLSETWSRHADDLAVLATGPRSAADRVSVTREQIEEQRARLPGMALGHVASGSGQIGTAGSFSAMPRPGVRKMAVARTVVARSGTMMTSRMGGEEFIKQARQRLEVLELLTLGTAFQFRLSGAVAAAWASSARAADRGKNRPALTAALTGRFAPAAVEWLGIDPDEVTVTPYEGPGWGTLAVTSAAGTGQLRACLPVSWLSDVWACGLAVLDGHLVVGVEEPGYPRARVLALRAPGADPVILDADVSLKRLDLVLLLPHSAQKDQPAWQGGCVGDRELAAWLGQAGVRRGDLVGLVVTPDGTAAVAPDPVTGDTARGLVTTTEQVARADAELRPRWATWSQETARRLVANRVRMATCWDIAAVHRLIYGGWRADPGWTWAHLHGLPLDEVPAVSDEDDGTPDLFSFPQANEADEPIGADGYLEPAFARGGWARTPEALLKWARLARETAQAQHAAITGAARVATACSESTAELLCAELAMDGLPVSLSAVEELLAGIIGPRPRGDQEAYAIRAARDAEVLKHAPPGFTADLRSPVQVKTLLSAAGADVPDTRAWRLEPLADTNPLVKALLEWRKAERIATTYGYTWLDAHLGKDGRLRGDWTGSDGAAGRMTASAGLHNMPAVLRRAVVAEPGHVFVRADLGQIEPRVLAAVSGDRALAQATRDDDMYLPVAKELGVDRPTAKVAMIAAMYGQTTGHGGEAARRMRKAYPVAMGYLDDGARKARNGNDLRTYGGRLVRMSEGGSPAQIAGRGRYGRNALIQGAAAELFKMWAVTVRARGNDLGAAIVMCLHDELVVHVPEESAEAATSLVGGCLAETARRWAPRGDVRFIADISVVRSWSDAKG